MISNSKSVYIYFELGVQVLNSAKFHYGNISIRVCYRISAQSGLAFFMGFTLIFSFLFCAFLVPRREASENSDKLL